MREDKLEKEEDNLSEEELQKVTGGIARPKPPIAPGSGSGM